MRRAAIALTFVMPLTCAAQTDAQARMACKQFIERQLHNPSRAKLDWTEGRTGRNSQGLHIVQIRGRAPNAMGAIVLATFECTLRYTAPDDFRLVNLRVY